jgi:ClpP class serine protease
MMAVAVKETGSLDVILDVNEYFTISEEYAKTGLRYLETDFIENDEELIDEMELELLDIYEDFAKQLEEI